VSNAPADLDAFMAELRAEVDLFEIYWRKNHKKVPDEFPMVMPKGNDGIWYEMFTDFWLGDYASRMEENIEPLEAADVHMLISVSRQTRSWGDFDLSNNLARLAAKIARWQGNEALLNLAREAERPDPWTAIRPLPTEVEDRPKG